MSIKHTLFSILKRELGEETNSNPAQERLDDESNRKLFYLAEKHDIAHIVASTYLKEGVLIEGELLEKFRKKLMLAIYRREQMNYTLSEVCKVFDDVNIPYILLKGAVLCRYYPEAWMRQSCDIDILVKEDDVERAIGLLCELGYKLQESSSIHDYSLYSPTNVHLELHFSLVQEGCLEKANSILESVWEHTVCNDTSSGCISMSNEMFVLYHVAHMAKHFIKGGCGIRSFVDLWIIKRKMKVNEEALDKLLIAAQLLDFYNAMCEMVDVWFEGATHNNVTTCIENYVFKGGVYGDRHNAVLMKAAGGENKTQFFLKLMFLPRKNLEILYPELKTHPARLPYYQVKRWFGVLNTSKRKRVTHMANMRNSVTREESATAKTLLDYLGIG